MGDNRIGMKERINEMRPKLQTGSALIVLKDQLVTDEFAKLGLRFRNVRARTNVDMAAFSRGMAAGNGVNLSGGASNVNSAPRAKMLGAR